jgi:peptidoglycan/LPS O-acetylase OafA/YrhL
MYSWIAMFGVNRRSVLMVLGLFLIVPFIGRLIYSINGELDIRRIALLRLDAITIGVMVAFVKINYQRFWVRKRLFGLLSVSLLVTSIYLIQFGTPVHESIALLLVPISFGFLVPLAERISRPSKIFASSIETISILSYSIYLSHMLVYGGLKEVFGYGTMTNWERLIYKCFTLLVILGVSGFVYRYFEKPLTDVRDLFKTRRETSAVPENG